MDEKSLAELFDLLGDLTEQLEIANDRLEQIRAKRREVYEEIKKIGTLINKVV